MKTTIKAVSVFLFAALMAAPALADRPESGLMKTELHGSLNVGKDGELELRFVPADGLKWNKDYPATVELENGKHVEFAQLVYKKIKGEIVTDGRFGKAALKAKGKAAGEDTITAVVSASVCDDETCHVIRKRKIPVQVVVR